MIAAILEDSHLDPTIVIGGRVNAFGGGSRSGRGSLLIAEADESDGTFLKLSPSIVVVTNIDREHLDYYKSLDKILESFAQFCRKGFPFTVWLSCARMIPCFGHLSRRYTSAVSPTGCINTPISLRLM